ncbi:MBL fold metallo-hydrolase [Brevibacterium yomogidense]|uniref:MBL fold metallo-hydrolase n=1 Tax=Brevibacterium yomogidense TaxID=946573 RepID=UPI0018DFCD6B|nr:MBL fold metallo-hydrolase [Brevibacterium yomogidense]
MTAQTDLLPLSTAQAQAWRDRVLPAPEQIAEGTWAVPVPIPDNPLRYTYSYLLAADDGVAVVDPGWDGAPRLDALLEGLRGAGYSPADIVGIVVTHYHRDHLGLVPALLSLQPDAWLSLHPHDIASVEAFRTRASHSTQGSLLALSENLGVPEERVRELASVFAGTAESASRTVFAFDWPDALLEVDDGMLLPVEGRTVRVLWTPGHTFGHIALHDEETHTFFSGDHVLPGISPNIGLDITSISHSLGDYLGSLDRMRGLPEEVAVAPAHGFRFSGLQVRAEQLSAHHDQRLEELRTRAAETDDQSVYSMCRGMQWARGFEGLSGFQLYAALMETAAHMHHLGMRVPALDDTDRTS